MFGKESGLGLSHKTDSQVQGNERKIPHRRPTNILVEQFYRITPQEFLTELSFLEGLSMPGELDIREQIVRIDQMLKAALENAQRDRELARRAVARTDQFEARLDAIAADIRSIRTDIAAIDIKLAALPNIEAAIRDLRLKEGR
jgi:hypothetical protein